jgi:hypothetical protein
MSSILDFPIPCQKANLEERHLHTPGLRDTVENFESIAFLPEIVNSGRRFSIPHVS